MKSLLIKTTLICLLLSSNANASSRPIGTMGTLPDVVINEFQADPAGDITGDANGDGVRDGVQDEFVEFYNNSINSLDISGWTLSDGASLRHTFPANTIIPGECSIVVFGGGTPTGLFGGSLVQIASSGSIGLNNTGDTITLNDGLNDVATYTYGSEGGNNQSVTRDPDITGSFVLHSTATGSGGSLFSPGTKTDGSFFTGCITGDIPPTVSSTVPADMASQVATNTTITINFSEQVAATASAVTIDCGAGNINFSGLPATTDTMVLTPDSVLPDNAFCTVNLIATEITDTDGGNDQLDGNGDTTAGDDYSWSFATGTPNLEIWQIQGDSTASPYAGFTVSSNNNIVTALDTNGFFMQTPDARDDADINTSNGIFVYTGTAPAVLVGDLIDVSGGVVEYFDFTEFSGGVSINVQSSGNPIPTAVLLNDSFPPNDPTVAVCSTDQATAKYECLEGMHFDMPQGFISSGYVSSFGANSDDVHVRAGTARAFREPGIDYPGLPGLPVFDTNPEILEMDIDGLTLPLTTFSAGSEVAIKGVFGYDFGEYEIWPSEITMINENVVPGAVRNHSNLEATIASANLFRFFNDIDDPGTQDDGSVVSTAEYQLKLTKLSKYFREDLKSPLIIAMQEVENINVLNDLAIRINLDGGPLYTAVLIEGNDVGGIDVGYLYQSSFVTVNSITQLGAAETQTSNGALLHDRPPLHMDASITLGAETMNIHLLVVHMRSRGGIEGTESTRVREKRFEQANSVAAMIDTIQTDNPGEAVITLGDFNAFQFTDGYVDVVGQITGTSIDADNEWWSQPVLQANPLTQAVQTLSSSQQYSYVFAGSAQVLDHALLNDPALLYFNQIDFARGQSDVNVSFEADNTNSLRVSDHDGLVLFLSLPSDLIFYNGFD